MPTSSRWTAWLVAALFSLCLDADSIAQTRFLMGYSSFSANQTPIWVAKEEGFFKRYGTDPDLILIEGRSLGVSQALV